MTVLRVDNVGIVVDDLEAATAFFVELGPELDGEATLEGRWVIRARRQAGAEAFARLINKLPAEELRALTAISTALEHLLELDEMGRDSYR